VIEVLGRTVAERSLCERCGAVLGRSLTLWPTSSETAGWRLLAITRCRGWRRHAYVAIVADVADDLRMSRFHRA
jgi:hypothetical protein